VAIQVYVNNIPFEIPVQGEQPPWGESLTDFLVEVATVLNSLKGTADILETSAIISNNVTTFRDIPDMKFNTATVRSFKVEGSIARTTDSTKLYEQFTLTGLRTDSQWLLEQEGIGNSGVIFDIDSSGQIQYKSTNMSGTNYSGLIKFRGFGILNS
jgi:hypothetical protein